MELISYVGLNTQQLVNFYFKLKIEVMATKNFEELINLVTKYSFVVNTNKTLPKAKKELFSLFLRKNFNVSSTIEQQLEKLTEMKNNLYAHFAFHKSRISALLVGSFSNGVINNNCSDLDAILILPKLPIREIEHEIYCLKFLEKNGFFYSDLCYFEDVKKIFETGKGMSRLYGLTGDGVGFDCFLLGEKDATNVTKIFPNKIERLREVPSRPDKRCGLSGNIRFYDRPIGYITNYAIEEGEIFKGFFLEEFLIAQEIYGDSKKIIDDVWLAVVKAFLYSNGYIKKRDGKYLIFLELDVIDKFIKTLYYSERKNYSYQRCREIELKFWQSAKELVKNSKMKLIIQ
jgi:hypothetical protein